MDFYVISRDLQVYDSVEPIGINKVFDVESIRRGKIEDLDDLPVQFYIKHKTENEYVDFIERPVPLISEKLKQVFEMYQKNIYFKPVVLADVKKMKQSLYWLFVPDATECLSPRSEFKMDGALKKLVIDEKKANLHRVFRVAGVLEDIVIVNQDVAESTLRRDFYGIKFTRVDKE